MKLSSEETYFPLLGDQQEYNWYEVQLDKERFGSNYFPDTHAVIIFASDMETAKY